MDHSSKFAEFGNELDKAIVDSQPTDSELRNATMMMDSQPDDSEAICKFSEDAKVAEIAVGDGKTGV